MRGGLSAKANVAASTDSSIIVGPFTDSRIVVTGLVAHAGGTATDVTFGSKPAGVDEVQTITVDATGGTYTISYSGQTTGNVDFDAAASAVQTELEGLSNLAPGDVVVTGDAGGPYTLTFGGTLADTDVAEVTCDATNLTGGASTATPATVTAGHSQQTAISALFALGVRTPLVLPHNTEGWFQTASGERLSVTTAAGSTVGVQVTYRVVPA